MFGLGCELGKANDGSRDFYINLGCEAGYGTLWNSGTVLPDSGKLDSYSWLQIESHTCTHTLN